MCGRLAREYPPAPEWKDHMFPTKAVFRLKKREGERVGGTGFGGGVRGKGWCRGGDGGQEKREGLGNKKTDEIKRRL